MTFSSERAMRRWLRLNAEGEIFWSEAAQGSTHGFPDAIILREGKTTYVELKLGECRNGLLYFEMHNSQRIVHNRIRSEDGVAWVVVGEKGGSRVWIGESPSPSLHAKADVNAEASDIKGRILHVMNPLKEITEEGL